MGCDPVPCHDCAGQSSAFFTIAPSPAWLPRLEGAKWSPSRSERKSGNASTVVCTHEYMNVPRATAAPPIAVNTSLIKHAALMLLISLAGFSVMNTTTSTTVRASADAPTIRWTLYIPLVVRETAIDGLSAGTIDETPTQIAREATRVAESTITPSPAGVSTSLATPLPRSTSSSEPPPASLMGGGHAVTGGIANYCWNGRCEDYVYQATGHEELTSTQSFSATLSLTPAQHPAAITLFVVQVTPENEVKSSDERRRWWRGGELLHHIALAPGQNVPISLDLSPGLYTFYTPATWAGPDLFGSIDYGFLVRVGEPDNNAPASSPKNPITERQLENVQEIEVRHRCSGGVDWDHNHRY